MTTTEITDELRLSMLKHLASGKDLDTVATITGKPRPLVLDVVSKHGYPDRLDKGIDLLIAKIEKGRTAEIPEGSPPRVLRPVTTSPSSITSPDARPVGPPDEIRVLLNTAKGHPAKRINNAADRAFDALDRLRTLLREDAEKHAAKRAAEAAKTAARAEVERLEAALREAKAKLRGSPGEITAPTTTRNTAPKGDYPCRNDGCDKHHDTPQGRSLHERRHCEHRAQSASA